MKARPGVYDDGSSRWTFWSNSHQHHAPAIGDGTTTTTITHTTEAVVSGARLLSDRSHADMIAAALRTAEVGSWMTRTFRAAAIGVVVIAAGVIVLVVIRRLLSKPPPRD